MPNPRKIVLHSLHGERPGLAALVADRIENLIDDLCLGDGSTPYFMLTAAHRPDESLEDAVFLAELLFDEFAGPVRVIEF